VILVRPQILLFLILVSNSGFSPALGKKNGMKNGSKLGRLYSSIGLSSWVMAFLMAPDKQSLKSVFLLSHFVNGEAETITVLSEEFRLKKYFTHFDRVAQVHQKQDAQQRKGLHFETVVAVEV
jgi:hypothetical protein